MKKLILIVALGLSSYGFSREIAPRKTCYKIEITLIDSSTGEKLGPSNIPLCIDWKSTLDPKEWKMINDENNDYFYLSAKTDELVKFESNGYTFSSLVAQMYNAQTLGTVERRYKKYSDGYDQKFSILLSLSSSWSFHLNKILAKNIDALPISLAAVVISQVNGSVPPQAPPGVMVFSSDFTRKSSSANSSVESKGYSDLRFEGIGYDDNSREYIVKAKLVYDGQVW